MPIDIHDAFGFMPLADCVPDILQEMRYATAFNFVGERIDGYSLPVALLTRPAAEAVRAAAKVFRRRGYVIRVLDAYRPQRATEHFLRWLEDASDARMKPYFYPEVDKSALIREDYIGPRSAHSRGSAVDMTLVSLRTGTELDMGGAFDYFGARSHADFREGLSGAQLANRRFLRDVMQDAGFLPLASEWWHFRLADEPFPGVCFDFPIDAEVLGRIARQASPRPGSPKTGIDET